MLHDNSIASMCAYTYIYIYIYMNVCMYIYIYIYVLLVTHIWKYKSGIIKA